MPVTVNADLPLDGDRERAWDDAAARARLAERCAGEGDAIEPDCYGRAFIWRDGDADPTTRGAYHLPVADVIDGEPRIVFRAVVAAARSVSPRATPGEGRAFDRSENELADMRSALAGLYERFAREFDDDEIVAPWEQMSAAATTGCGSGCSCQPAMPTPASPKKDQSAPAPEGTMTTTDVNDHRSRVLRASATGDMWSPPVEHFANPHLAEPTKITVTADGRVYGHLATWDQPHVGYDGKLIYPPRNASGAYEYFRQSKVVCADGTPLAVGLLTMNTGHADETLTARAAQSHYDHTGTIAAAVNIGEDAIGIWMAGSMLPDVSADQRRRFALARVSGDWRQPQPNSPLELIAALSVPNPGFPVRQNAELLASDRYTLAASGLVRAEGGEIRTLISAGTAVVDEGQQAQLVEAVRSAMNSGLIEELKIGLADVVRAEVARSLAEAKIEAPASTPGAPEGGDSGAPASAPVEPASEPEPGAGDAEAAGHSHDDAASAPTPESAPPAAEAAPAPIAEQAQVAASALSQRVRRHRATSARDRLLAAANLAPGKKA